jgi:hypothetical protein
MARTYLLSVNGSDFEIGTARRNPNVALVPSINEENDAYNLLMRIPSEYSDPAPRKLREVREPLSVASSEGVRLLNIVQQAMVSSFRERDVRSIEFLSLLTSSSETANNRRSMDGHRVPLNTVQIPNNGPRGILVIQNEGTGQEGLQRSIEEFFWSMPSKVRQEKKGQSDGCSDVNKSTTSKDAIDSQRFIAQQIKVWEGDLSDTGERLFSERYVRIPILSVPFPLDGCPKYFTKSFLSAVDSVFGSTYAKTISVAGSEQDLTRIIKAFVISLNIGSLLVGFAHTEAARTAKAGQLWTILGEVTCDTGVPICSFMTPGAAAAFSERSGPVEALSSLGTFLFEPFALNENLWIRASEILWLVYLGRILGKQPSWFSQTLWCVTLGHIGLAVKVCRRISGLDIDWEQTHFDGKKLLQFSKDELIVEKPHLDAIKTAYAGGTFTARAIRRHGDWLPVELVMSSVPGLNDGTATDFEREIERKERFERLEKILETLL